MILIEHVIMIFVDMIWSSSHAPFLYSGLISHLSFKPLDIVVATNPLLTFISSLLSPIYPFISFVRVLHLTVVPFIPFVRVLHLTVVHCSLAPTRSTLKPFFRLAFFLLHPSFRWALAPQLALLWLLYC
jgi:hypothetical protein